MKMLYQIGKALYPVGAGLGKTLGFTTFTPAEVNEFDVQGEEDGIPNAFSGSLYAVSVTHVLVGFALALLLAKPLKLVKPVVRYRQKRATRRTARK